MTKGSIFWGDQLLSAIFRVENFFQLENFLFFTENVGKFFRGPVSAVKPKKSFLSLARLRGGGGGGRAARPPLQIAWRSRAIGSARNQYLLILARMQQSILTI